MAGEENIPYVEPLFKDRLSPASVPFQFHLLLLCDGLERTAGSERAWTVRVPVVCDFVLFGVKDAEAEVAVEFGQHMFPFDMLLDVLNSA